MRKTLTIILCFTAGLLAAQEQIHPVIQVERLYDADLIEVSKPTLDTSIPDSLRTFHTLFEYKIFDKPLVNLYDFAPLPPALARAARGLEKQYGYINLGTGYPWTPKADVFLQAPLPSGWYAGLQANHRSLLSTDTRLTTTGLFALEHRGKNNTFRLYAPAEVLSHSFTGPGNAFYYKTGGGLETFSHKSAPGDWHYYWKSEYLHAINNVTKTVDNIPKIRENVLNLKALAGYNMSEKFRINLGMSAQFASDRWSPDSVSVSGATAHLFPHVVLNGARYKVAAGIKIGYLLRPDNNKLGFFPWFDTHLVLAKDVLTLFARVDGYQKLNTFQDRISENPWVTANELFDAYVPWDVQAGITGTVADRFQYKIYGAYRYMKNRVYYGAQPSVVDFTGMYRTTGMYRISYADETRYSAVALLSFQTKPIMAGISGSWHKYALNTGNPPWHEPEWEVQAYVRYNIRERIVFSVDAHWQAACFAPDWIADNPPVEIPSFINLRAQAEYVLHKGFSVYVFGDNLLNKKISLFYLYPNPGLTLGGGITLRF